MLDTALFYEQKHSVVSLMLLKYFFYSEFVVRIIMALYEQERWEDTEKCNTLMYYSQLLQSISIINANNCY